MKCQIEHTAFEGYNICCVQSKSSIVIFLKVLHAYRKYIYNYKLCTLEIELICHHEHLTTFRFAVVILCGVWKPSAVKFITFLMFEFKDILITAATWYLCPKAKAVENRWSSISMHYKPQNSNSDFMGAFLFIYILQIFLISPGFSSQFSVCFRSFHTWPGYSFSLPFQFSQISFP